MRKISVLLIAALVFAGCDKVKVYAYDVGSATFINASPGISGVNPEPGMFIYVDTVMMTASVIPYKGNTSYLKINPGTRKIEVRSSVDSVTKLFEAPNEDIVSKTGYTYLIYDTLSVVNPKLKALKLDDDLKIPPADKIKFRFINAAVNSMPLDVTFLRLSVTPNDSVTITNQTYIGAAPVSATYSSFNYTMSSGTYMVKLKTAGTQTVQDTLRVVFPPPSCIYTFFATGSAKGLPTSVGAYRHYP